ncbi:MAG TPA: hypothetical protein GXZ32_00780 [Clostridiales bacterium]|nr:hypothetical protein [Clostridiales bacterium]
MWIFQGIGAKKNRLKEHIDKARYWMIPLALLAFWFPVDAAGINPDFSPLGLIVNESMVTFCMIVPVISVVAVLMCEYISIATIKFTGIVGTLFGIINAITWFAVNTDMRWMGVLHLPLLIISFYMVILTRKAARSIPI